MKFLRSLFFCRRGRHRVMRNKVRHDNLSLVGKCRDCGDLLRKSGKTGQWLAAEEA